MRQDQLEHAIRTAYQIIGRHEVIVVGSLSILGTFREDQLPADATRSVEIDILPIADDNSETERLADPIEGVAGEFSPFEELHGFSIDGVDLTTSALPTGWHGRLVKVQNANTAAPDGEPQYTGWCLDKKTYASPSSAPTGKRTGISSRRSYDPRSSTATPSIPGSPPWTSATAQRPRWPPRGSARYERLADPDRHVKASGGRVGRHLDQVPADVRDKLLLLGLDVARESDSASDYERSFRRTQRDDLRLPRRSDLREPDQVRPPQRISLRLACRRSGARIPLAPLICFTRSAV
jgi:hypothetical protein